MKRKASELQLRKVATKKWTEDEEKHVKAYLIEKIDFCQMRALLPNRSIPSIRKKETELEKKLNIGFCPYCSKYNSKDSEKLTKHKSKCERNPKSSNYAKPPGYDELKERIYSSHINSEIYDLFHKKALSFSEIRFHLKEKHNIITYQQKGNQMPKSLNGFSDIFLEIIGIDSWREYNEINIKNKQQARRKSGFTKKLKDEIKTLFENKCAMCNETKNLQIHHIDGDFKNNDKKNLILLCQDHHYLAERLKCMICGRDLIEIIKGITINGVDISELKGHYGYICKKHGKISL